MQQNQIIKCNCKRDFYKTICGHYETRCQLIVSFRIAPEASSTIVPNNLRKLLEGINCKKFKSMFINIAQCYQNSSQAYCNEYHNNYKEESRLGLLRFIKNIVESSSFPQYLYLQTYFLQNYQKLPTHQYIQSNFYQLI